MVDLNKGRGTASTHPLLENESKKAQNMCRVN